MVTQYIEVITEFFYMTILSVLNPLMPLFCLLANSIAMRLQAKWLVTTAIRQVPKRFVRFSATVKWFTNGEY